MQSFFWRRLEDWTRVWEGPPPDHEELWSFGRQCYEQFAEWYGPPIDPILPMFICGSSARDSQRHKTYCNYDKRTRRYHIVIHNSEIPRHERLYSVAHEMFHRVMMQRGGVQKECWLAEVCATIAADEMLRRSGYPLFVDSVRATAVKSGPKGMSLDRVRAYKRDGKPYPEGFFVAIRCLAFALTATIPPEDINRLAGAATLSEWLTSLRGDAEYIAHTVLEERLPSRAQFARGTIGQERLALALYYKGDWDGCIREADALIHLDTRNPVPYGLKGRIWLRRNDFHSAVSSLEQAAGSRGANPLLLKDLASAYMGMGAREQAARYARRAALEMPEDPRIHLFYGNVLIEQGDRVAARLSWRKAADLGSQCGVRVAALKQLWKYPDPSEIRVRPRKGRPNEGSEPE